MGLERFLRRVWDKTLKEPCLDSQDPALRKGTAVCRSGNRYEHEAQGVHRVHAGEALDNESTRRVGRVGVRGAKPGVGEDEAAQHEKPRNPREAVSEGVDTVVSECALGVEVTHHDVDAGEEPGHAEGRQVRALARPSRGSTLTRLDALVPSSSSCPQGRERRFELGPCPRVPQEGHGGEGHGSEGEDRGQLLSHPAAGGGGRVRVACLNPDLGHAGRRLGFPLAQPRPLLHHKGSGLARP